MAMSRCRRRGFGRSRSRWTRRGEGGSAAARGARDPWQLWRLVHYGRRRPFGSSSHNNNRSVLLDS